MKQISLLLGLILLLSFGCEKDDDDNTLYNQSDIYGVWMLINPLNYNGVLATYYTIDESYVEYSMVSIGDSITSIYEYTWLGDGLSFDVIGETNRITITGLYDSVIGLSETRILKFTQSINNDSVEYKLKDVTMLIN